MASIGQKFNKYTEGIINDNKLVMDTLSAVSSKEKDVQGLIIHSDLGFQYTSYEYKVNVNQMEYKFP